MARFLAVMLAAGGVVGIGIGAWLAYVGLQQSALLLLVIAPFIALFAWSVCIGVGLWRGSARGRRWAPILFATQIPIIATAGPTASWFTGLLLAPTLSFDAGSTTMGFAVNLGASGNVSWGSEEQGILVGINLFAVFALVSLLRMRHAGTQVVAARADDPEDPYRIH